MERDDWIAVCAHQLQRQWRTVDPDQLDHLKAQKRLPSQSNRWCTGLDPGPHAVGRGGHDCGYDARRLPGDARARRVSRSKKKPTINLIGGFLRTTRIAVVGRTGFEPVTNGLKGHGEWKLKHEHMADAGSKRAPVRAGEAPQSPRLEPASHFCASPPVVGHP